MNSHATVDREQSNFNHNLAHAYLSLIGW